MSDDIKTAAVAWLRDQLQAALKALEEAKPGVCDSSNPPD